MVKYISNIRFQPDYHTIFSRLGYKKRSASVSDSFITEVKDYIDEAASLITLNGAAVRLKIENKNSEDISVLDPTGEIFVIKSRYLSKFLKDSSEILLMGITGGIKIMDSIAEQQKNNMTKAVVLDAAAGEIVDSGLDFIMSLYRRDLVRESKHLLTKRFSPGYGDLNLDIQQIIFNILHLEKLEIKLTKSFLMVPEKSVIAVTGII